MKKTIKQDNFTILKNNNNEIIYQNKIYEKIGDLFFKSLFYIRDKNKSLMENLKIKKQFYYYRWLFFARF